MYIKKTFFDGRINRKQYWLRLLGLIPIMFVTGFFYALVNNMSDNEIGAETYDRLIYLTVFVMIAWVALISIKRLKDMGQNPVFALGCFVPYVAIGVILYCGFFQSKEDNESTTE